MLVQILVLVVTLFAHLATIGIMIYLVISYFQLLTLAKGLLAVMIQLGVRDVCVC